MSDTEYTPRDAPEGVTVEKFILSQFLIEYNADRIVRIDRWTKGDRSQVQLYPSDLVSNAKAVAEDEGRTFINMEEVISGRP